MAVKNSTNMVSVVLVRATTHYTTIPCRRRPSLKLISSFLFPYSSRPGSLDVSFIRAELALSTEEEWQKFEGGMSLAYTDVSKTKIDCKKSAVDVAAA